MVLTTSYLRALVDLCHAEVYDLVEFIEFQESSNPALFVARNLELRRRGDDAQPPNKSLSNLGKLITNRSILFFTSISAEHAPGVGGGWGKRRKSLVGLCVCARLWVREGEEKEGG